ncbi:MAG: hypothetical protein KAT14_03075 [Candidatus Marinimicrobia bacterium]|nr:hypothetical protein [Candidatus Neomarinimicrobiota bacterium]
MKRFASMDFMRGMAIALMLVLHMVLHTLDVNTLSADLSHAQFIQFILMVILPFGGGLAGFFLMVSAMGNTVSMEHELRRNISATTLASRQVIGGFILLLFAMLVEGLIGYHGDVGVFVHESLKAVSDPALGPVHWTWDHALWRFNHFETIHTIAWCIIINGVIHASLVHRKKYRDKNKLIEIYVILVVLVLLVTPLVWGLVNLIIPDFPAQLGSYVESYPRIGTDSFGRILLVFFLQPLAGHPEPLFPYLAVSFIGTIFGIFLSMPKEQRKPQTFVKNTLRIGMIMYLIGLIGLLINVFYIAGKFGFDAGLNLYMDVWDHRGWTQNLLGVPFVGWYFQFMLLNGFSILLIMSVIRLVDMRGKSTVFGNKTRFVRRFGFVAFTNYTIQFLYFIAMFIVLDWIFGIPYGRNVGLWGHTFVTIVIGISMFALLMLLWERIRFAGSLEWMIKQVNYFLNPARRKVLKERGVKWYQAGLLNVQRVIYNPEWLDIIPENEIDHVNYAESKLAKKLALVGLVFPPYAIVGFIIAWKARAQEGGSREHRQALTWSIISLIFLTVWLVLFSILTPASFGLSI